jgi:flagellar biogenesis protein FliO
MEYALLKTLASLVAVLGLMALLVMGIRKFLNTGFSRRTDVVDIQILSQKSLHPKRMLYVVKVLNKVLVLSSTEHGVNSVGEISDESVISTLEIKQAALAEEKSAGLSGFKQRIRGTESLGDFFHKPFNVVLWRAEKAATQSTFTKSPKLQ